MVLRAHLINLEIILILIPQREEKSVMNNWPFILDITAIDSLANRTNQIGFHKVIFPTNQTE